MAEQPMGVVYAASCTPPMGVPSSVVCARFQSDGLDVLVLSVLSLIFPPPRPVRKNVTSQ